MSENDEGLSTKEVLDRLIEARPSFIEKGLGVPPQLSAPLVTSGLDGSGPNRHLPRKPNENFGSGAPSSSNVAPELNILIRCLKDSGGVVSVATVALYGAEV